MPLNKTGKKQAKDLASLLRNIHFDKIISSDLERAVKTVEEISLERNLVIITTKALREKHYGNYEGKLRKETKEELKSLFEQWVQLNDTEKMKFKIYESGETDEEALSRFMRYLRETAVVYQGKTILISCHGGLMRYLLIKLGYGTYEEMNEHSVKNTSYIKLESDGIDFFLKELCGIEKA